MRIRKFTVALAVSALAVAGLSTPTASAIDVKVSGDICTITESYNGESDDLFGDYFGIGDSMISVLKDKLNDDDMADVDRFLALDNLMGEESMALIQQLQTAGKDADFTEGEVYKLTLAAKATKIDLDSLAPGYATNYADASITRAEAAESLINAQERRQHLDEDRTGTDAFLEAESASAKAVVAPLRSFLITLHDAQIDMLQSCVDGKNGSFQFTDGGNNPGTGTNPAKGGSSAPSGGSSR